jgi:unsaturated rhamnogalacturonyl hydrolase
MHRKYLFLFLLFTLLIPFSGNAQEIPLSQQMAATVMEIWPDSMAVKADKPAAWNYEQGVILEGFQGVWKNSADPTYFQYIKKSIDFYVTPTGDIRTYKKGEFNIDHVKTGRSLLFLYKVTGDLKYYKAAQLLRDQLKHHPRNQAGGFWHKQVYPNQMWLDGLYMGEPFYAEWAATFNEPEAFDDIAKQFILMEKHARDAKTGLLFHGWDESKEQRWANASTGCSPNFWGRAMGWYGMALVDVLDEFPKNHPKYDSLVAIFKRWATAIQKVQDPNSGLWYEVLDKPSEQGNYKESSASCMFVYALAKGTRKGLLTNSFAELAKKGYEGIKKEFVEKRSESKINLTGTVSVAGLGGNPYRDGSYAYYLSEKVVSNDPKGIGAFLLASNEMEIMPSLSYGKGKTVLLDQYFNHETRTDSTGIVFPHHYVWNQEEQNGFSLLGYIFNKNGVATHQTDKAPTADLLRKVDIYIIVDPDNLKESPTPHFITEQHVTTITDWVKNGGVLLLFANDSGHAELSGLNLLGRKFGIHFEDKTRNMVKGKDYPSGAIRIPASHPIFPHAQKVYLKEICTLGITPPATSGLTEGTDVIIAVTKLGKGTVFAVGDPWLYNEYVDGRKIPAEYQNYQAAEDLVRWTLQQCPKKTK